MWRALKTILQVGNIGQELGKVDIFTSAHVICKRLDSAVESVTQ